jgi:hypothetical protein
MCSFGSCVFTHLKTRHVNSAGDEQKLARAVNARRKEELCRFNNLASLRDLDPSRE